MTDPLDLAGAAAFADDNVFARFAEHASLDDVDEAIDILLGQVDEGQDVDLGLSRLRAHRHAQTGE